MSQKNERVKRMFLLGKLLELLIMLFVILIFYRSTKSHSVILLGVILIFCAQAGDLYRIILFSVEIDKFADGLCCVLNSMKNKEKMNYSIHADEYIFSKIYHHLEQLYQIMQQDQKKVNSERKELQMLISDISHQIKTPMSNLLMIVDTMLKEDISNSEQEAFLKEMKGQAEKLEFLFESMIKTSRLETRIIQLSKVRCSLYDTIGKALGTIVYRAEAKKIDLSIECPEDIFVSHDSKWTAEAIFNLLDNAVKYTAEAGKIFIRVEELEMYVRIKISDTGKGIPLEHQSLIFQRFYREPEVHEQPGVGIGLYLTREIIARQGGYVTVHSIISKGTDFCIYIPYK